MGIGLGLCCCGVDCCFGFRQDPAYPTAILTLSGATTAPFSSFNGVHVLPFLTTFTNAHFYGYNLPANPNLVVQVSAICHPSADPSSDGYRVYLRDVTVGSRELYWHCGDDPLFFPSTPTDPRCDLVKTDGGSWTHATAGLEVDDLVFG